MLLFDSPCEWINNIITPVDCSGWKHRAPDTLHVFVFLIVTGILWVVSDAIYRGRLRFAMPLTKWIHTIKDKGILKLEAWEICFITVPIGLYLFWSIVYLAGFDYDSLIVLLLPTGALVGLQLYMQKQEEDPHKDLPEEVRTMSAEELKLYTERLELLNRVRDLRGETKENIFQNAQSLAQVELDLAQALKQFPQFKQQLKRMAEVKTQRLMEKL